MCRTRLNSISDGTSVIMAEGSTKVSQRLSAQL